MEPSQTGVALAAARLPRAYSVSRSEQQRLQTYIGLNLVAVLLAIGWLVVARVWLVPSDWVAVIILLLMALSVCLLGAGVLLRRHRYVAAIVTVAVSNWAICIAAVAIVPSALQILPLVVLLQTLLALPHLNRAQLGGMLGATVIVAAALAAVGRLQDGVGLDEQTPSWVLDAMPIMFIPITAALVVFLAWQSHVSLSAKAEALQDSRARLGSATDRERRKIERYLHDGAQQRLVAAATQLRVADRLLSKRPEQVSPLINQLAQDLQEASAELRDLAHGIYPPELTEHGLEAALRTAALRSPLPTRVRAEGVGRYPSEIEVNVYFCCLEALQNAIKHGGEKATVTISLQDRAGLWFEVRDTGQGCEPAALQAGHGFTNMSDRLGAVGGSLSVQSHRGAGVQVEGHIGLPR